MERSPALVQERMEGQKSGIRCQMGASATLERLVVGGAGQKASRGARWAERWRGGEE